MNLFFCYEKCSTCKKAKTFLEKNKIVYSERNIKENNPSYEELKAWVEKYKIDIKKLFNTSGILYREMKLSDKMKLMSDEEKLKLLATDGMLVKRPLFITDNKILVGFKEKEWENIDEIN